MSTRDVHNAVESCEFVQMPCVNWPGTTMNRVGALSVQVTRHEQAAPVANIPSSKHSEHVCMTDKTQVCFAS